MRDFQIAVPIFFTEWLPHVGAATRGSSQRTLQAACHDPYESPIKKIVVKSFSTNKCTLYGTLYVGIHFAISI
jgi:hypothetical protein